MSRLIAIAAGGWVILVLHAGVVSAQAPRYELTWIFNELNPGETCRLKDLNEDGIVVGNAGGFENWGSGTGSWKRAIMYDQINGMINLNELPGVTWTDMETFGSWDGTVSPWIAIEASGITETNAFGEIQIVGTAIHPDFEHRAFVLTISPVAAPQFLLLKHGGAGGNGGSAINDLGVVVANGDSNNAVVVFDPATSYEPVEVWVGTEVQEINNWGTIVTRFGASNGGFVITPGNNGYVDANVDEIGADLYGVNDYDVVCGHSSGSGKGKNRDPGGIVSYPYAFPHTASSDDVIDPDGVGYFCDVNSSGSVCYDKLGRGWVYIGGTGTFNLDEQINFSSSQDETDWLSTSIQCQGINDAGQIIIRNWMNGNSGALLTPVIPSGTTYTSDDTPLAIPDNNPNGVQSVITVDDDVVIQTLTVNVNVDHSRPDDLVVNLVGPGGGNAIPLQVGANVVTSFNGSSSQGDWTLQVSDIRRRQSGDLVSWSITVED